MKIANHQGVGWTSVQIYRSDVEFGSSKIFAPRVLRRGKKMQPRISIQKPVWLGTEIALKMMPKWNFLRDLRHPILFSLARQKQIDAKNIDPWCKRGVWELLRLKSPIRFVITLNLRSFDAYGRLPFLFLFLITCLVQSYFKTMRPPFFPFFSLPQKIWLSAFFKARIS